MELYEIMLQYPAKREKIAAEIASFTQADGTAQVCAELAAILRRMQETQALAARPELSPELAAAAGASYALERQELAAIFTQICRALGTAGVTLSGGEISSLKRQGMPDTLAAELAALRRDKIATIPEAERLGADDAAALYYGLTRQGLISGPCAAFVYYLGKPSNRQAKPAKKALSWTGTAADFAYFVQRLANLAAALQNKTTSPNRAKALCLAFGIDERQRVNVINPYLTDMHKPKGSAEIDAIFNALPSSKETH
jgi:hypothetical protein